MASTGLVKRTCVYAGFRLCFILDTPSFSILGFHSSYALTSLYHDLCLVWNTPVLSCVTDLHFVLLLLSTLTLRGYVIHEAFRATKTIKQETTTAEVGS